MTISSSLNAGVAGLNVNATRLATISDNIANSSTYGYKRAAADFSAMVSSSGGADYSAGGVRVSTMRLIDERGTLIGTSNATDIAVDGRGFLPVTSITEVEGGADTYPIRLTTTGSFRPDANGVLRTPAGDVLMGWPLDADGNLGGVSRDSVNDLQPVRLNTTEFVASPTTAVGLAINLPATATRAGAAGTTLDLPVGYHGNLSTDERLDITFTPTVPGAGASNTWTMTIRDSASTGAVIGEYTVVFDDSQASGGRLLSVATVSGGAYDAATGTIPLTVGGGLITMTIGSPGATGGITQLSDTYAPNAVTKNGAGVARQTSVEIDENGFLYAVYDQGFSRRLYQIPVVDVPNANGLKAMSNQSFAVTTASGPFYLWDAGDGPTGTTQGFAREESTTDVAAELTNLIVTQRAYSSNAKVIQTVDEMLQETTNIKR